jgi:signal transduction histidine kinase
MAVEHVPRDGLKPDASLPGAPEDEIVLRRHQAETQLGSLRAIFVTNTFAAVMVAFALRNDLPAEVSLPWLLLMAAVFHPSRRYWMAKFARFPSGWRPGGWEFRMALTGAVSGFSWTIPTLAASGGIVPMREVLLNSLTVALVTVTYAMNPVNRAMFFGYAFALLTPVTLRNLLSGEPVLGVVAVLTVPFVGLLSVHQGIATRRQMRAIAHERENRRLASEIEDANRRLQLQIEELAAAKAEAERAWHDAMAAKDHAESATRAKTAFLATMSHELRTPLNAINGFSEVMHGEMFGPLGHARYKEYAGDINQSGRHLLSIINDLLDMSKIEAGKLEIEDVVGPVAAYVEDALRLMAGQAASRRIKLEADAVPPHLLLRADARAVRQMLLNLISNAVKFTDPGGSVRVAASVGPCGLRLTVADTGVGIPPEELNRVVEPFRQVAGPLSRSRGGTGLGLAIVKSLADVHGARLELSSRLGEGTVVSIVFPPDRVAEPASVNTPVEAAAKGA